MFFLLENSLKHRMLSGDLSLVSTTTLVAKNILNTKMSTMMLGPTRTTLNQYQSIIYSASLQIALRTSSTMSLYFFISLFTYYHKRFHHLYLILLNNTYILYLVLYMLNNYTTYLSCLSFWTYILIASLNILYIFSFV